ncbi:MULTISPECIES: hypothetical protein [unclassified Endozoicomonas]|uniref:hypothetical protein n=1 Tax=unclassified Endozoicomonas TaxID=2644528 RepID=UPI003BB7A78B
MRSGKSKREDHGHYQHLATVQALIPEGSKVIATITALNGNGTSQSELSGGSVVTVRRESVGLGQKAFIQGER